MKSFVLNGDVWRVIFVRPNSRYLVDRTGKSTLATTDPITNCIYISNTIQGELLTKVLIHELGHCTICSFGLFHEIHRMVRPEYWIDAEEWVCNFIADYGRIIFNKFYEIVGHRAWEYLPYELERLVS